MTGEGRRSSSAMTQGNFSFFMFFVGKKYNNAGTSNVPEHIISKCAKLGSPFAIYPLIEQQNIRKWIFYGKAAALLPQQGLSCDIAMKRVITHTRKKVIVGKKCSS